MASVTRLDLIETRGLALVAGADFMRVFRFASPSGIADNWTGLSARGQIRLSATSNTVLATIYVTILDPRAHWTQIHVLNADTAALQATGMQRAWYDVELYSTGDAWVQRLCEGVCQLKRNVTR